MHNQDPLLVGTSGPSLTGRMLLQESILRSRLRRVTESRLIWRSHSSSVGAHGVAKGGGQYTCGVCRRFTGTGKALRQHIGGHELEADWAKYGKEKPVFACGLCGERESHGVNPPKDPDTLVGCFMYFIGAQAVHHCKLVTEEKPYGSHASADKSRWKQELSADGRLRLADWPWPVERRQLLAVAFHTF